MVANKWPNVFQSVFCISFYSSVSITKIETNFHKILDFMI